MDSKEITQEEWKFLRDVLNNITVKGVDSMRRLITLLEKIEDKIDDEV